jgi:N-acetylmuramoyl-L-alanine amidase
MPSVLVEAGVIVNRHEEARMLDPAVRSRIAQAIARGVGNCLP